MKYQVVLCFLVLLPLCCNCEDTNSIIVNNVTEPIPGISTYSMIPPGPPTPLPPKNGTTTVNPNNTTTPASTTTARPPPPTNATTPAPTTSVPPTTPTNSTSTSTTSTTPKTTATSSTARPTEAPTSKPLPVPGRKFDGPSFMGGIVLAAGLTAIGFVAFKFYKARTELNYRTL